MPDVGKQTKPIVKMECPVCFSDDTIFRLPRDTSLKESKLFCKNCSYEEYFP